MEEIQDPLYQKAVSVVLARNTASISLLQRTFLIGYNRAARLLEAMEIKGVVSAIDWSGHRSILQAESQHDH